MNFNYINREWLVSQMAIHGKKQIDVCNALNITQSDLSKYLSESKPLSSRTKTLLYYFFRCLELEKELKK
jgi:predicted transcriptional regulator